MRAPRRSSLLVLPLLIPGLAGAGEARAQNITIRTVPVPTGEQFLLFPSRTFGMGSVGIALDDRDGRPFANPAVRLEGDAPVRLFAIPTFYGEANQWVGGRTLPVAMLFAGERIHGGAGVAVQQLQDRRGWWGSWEGDGRSIQEDPANTYLFATAGLRLTDGLSAGVSALHSTLGAVDGVNMLYGRANRIRQEGTVSEYRLGVEADLGVGRLDGTVTATDVDMVHDVDYVEWVWSGDPNEPGQLVQWTERNEDRTVTWGTRLRYTRPAGDASRVGILVAGSVKDHPKIPNYNIVDIPRDPGHSAVFNIGAGMARTEDGATFSLEALFEPGRSHTWAFADSVTTLPSGATLEPGDKTVDNRFSFRNWSIGLGFEREYERLSWQLGLRARQINYDLDQHHYLAEVRRETRESWMEWVPSWGAAAWIGGMEVRYSGRFTARGWPPVDRWWGGPVLMADAATSVDFVVGPTGEVNLPAYRVTTHRITLSVPMEL